MFDPSTWETPYAVTVALLFVIVLCRTNATYWLGRGLASGAEHTKAKRMLEAPGYTRATRWLGRWGAPVVALCYLTVGVQSLIHLAAGVTRMPLARYIPATIVGSIMWAFFYGTVGFAGIAAFHQLWLRSPIAVIALTVLLVATIAVLVARRAPATAKEDSKAAVEV